MSLKEIRPSGTDSERLSKVMMFSSLVSGSEPFADSDMIGLASVIVIDFTLSVEAVCMICVSLVPVRQSMAYIVCVPRASPSR